jgi:thiamine biosynthesis protein ThiS
MKMPRPRELFNPQSKNHPSTISMTLQINGEPCKFEAPLSLAALVEHLGMKPDRVAVELNRSIVPREQWAGTALQEGDRLEIVHFVGGGSRT